MRTQDCFSHLIKAAQVSNRCMCLAWDQSGQKLKTNLQRQLSLQITHDSLVAVF